MTRWEALIRQLTAMAMNNKRGATHALHQLRKLFPAPEPQGPPKQIFVSEDDMRL